MNELLHNHVITDFNLDIQNNLEDLLNKINIFREAYGKPMIVTSGIRTVEDHFRLYKEKGTKAPMGSQHLQGRAVDIYDEDGELMKYCKENVPLLESIGLWIEDDNSVPRVHFQTVPPKSGHRFFKP